MSCHWMPIACIIYRYSQLTMGFYDEEMLPILKWLLVILRYYDMALLGLGAGRGRGRGDTISLVPKFLESQW